MSAPAMPHIPEGAVPHQMRAPCPDCGILDGYLRTKGGQDLVSCINCGRYCYAAPKTETGRAVRSVSTTRAEIKPKKRAAVLIRAHQRCELCGRPGAATEAGLHVDHVLTVDAGHKLGLTDDQINDQINDLENLAALCTECNLGKGNTTLPLWLFAAIIRARTMQQQPEGGE